MLGVAAPLTRVAPLLHHAGPPLPANTPINMQTASGTYVNVDNSSAAAYPASGSGTSAPETFMAVDPSNPNSTTPISPMQTTVLQSSQTGLYCRLATLGAGPEMGMICDVETLADATAFTYTGSGLSYGGVPLVSTGPGAPLVLANTTSATLDANADHLVFAPTGDGPAWAASAHLHGADLVVSVVAAGVRGASVGGALLLSGAAACCSAPLSPQPALPAACIHTLPACVH